MLGVLNGMNWMGKSRAEMVNLAGGNVAWNRGNFYIFGTRQDYINALGGACTVQPSAGSAAFTCNDPTTLMPMFSAIFVQVNGVANPFIPNAVAHEMGHWFDPIVGGGITREEKITLGGAITVGNQIDLTVTNGTISGGSATVSATSVGGDTLATMATKLAAAVNASVPLTSKGFAAVAAGDSLTVSYNGTSGPVYKYTITGGGAITEQVWLAMGTKASETPLFIRANVGDPAGSNNGDIYAFNLLGACTNTGVFREQIDSDDKYICATRTNATVLGNFQVGNLLTLTFTDAEIAPPVGQTSVSVLVQAGDTRSTLATKFANAIGANADLVNAQITATASATNIAIVSASGNQTQYAFNGGGGPATMDFTNQGEGRENKLTKKYNSLALNWANLDTAWPQFFVQSKEIFAEKFAAQNGGTTDRAFPGAGANPQSLDWYLQRNPHTFDCSFNIIDSGGARLPPTNFPAGCPN